MKFLLLILFSFNAYSFSLPDISKMQVSCTVPIDSEVCLDMLPSILLRLGYNRFTFGNDESKNSYENLLLDPEPTLGDLQSELGIMKGEFAVEENARIAEVKRRKDLKDRIIAIGGIYGNYKSLSGLNGHMAKCGFNGNIPILIQKYIDENDVAKFTCLESKDAEVKDARTKSINDRAASKRARQILKNYKCDMIDTQVQCALKVLNGADYNGKI